VTRTRDQIERCLRWYPPAWSARYGEELVSLSEDVHGTDGLTVRDRASIVRSGMLERAQAAGLRGTSAPPARRVRSASLVVLCSWSAFVVAGAVFAKFSDNWRTLTPPRDRRLPGAGYSTVQWAAGIGLVIVVVSSLWAVPALLRLVRGGGWSAVRRPIASAAIAGISMVALTAGLASWARHLSGPARNGGSAVYGAAFLAWAVCGVAALCVTTASGVTVATRLPLSDRSTRALGLAAAVLTIDMVFVLGGLLAWWAGLADRAPGVLGGGLLATGTVVPPALVGSALVMVGALVAGGAGACRILGSLRSVGSETH